MDPFDPFWITSVFPFIAFFWYFWRRMEELQKERERNYSLLDWQRSAQEQTQQMRQSTWTHFKMGSIIIPSDLTHTKEAVARKCVNCGATAKGKCEYCGSEG